MTAKKSSKTSSGKSQKRQWKLSDTIIVALITLIGTIVAALLGSPLLDKWISTDSVPTETLVRNNTPFSNSTPLSIETFDAKGVQMILVPVGEFTMGSDNFDEDERPLHKVFLDAFLIDKYEVTNANYKACVAEGICAPLLDTGSITRSKYYDNVEYDNYPVINVNWLMAETYCIWRGARLPTEAEWEKAARGDQDARRYPWGNFIDNQEVNLNFCDKNCIEDWGDKNYDDGYNDTAPVDSFPNGASIYGVYNMAGNVSEWVFDWYQSDYYSLPESSNNPRGPLNGTTRVFRGGSFGLSEYWLRVSVRMRNDPESLVYGLNYSIGFRCAREP